MPRVLVTGGAGFLGSHLCERLIEEDCDVICCDSLLTGRSENLDQIRGHERFRFQESDVTRHLSFDGSLDWVLHFASPASPRDYMDHPIHTLKVGALGTHNALGLALEKRAGFMLASTSEVYGDPKVHPQPESYWGNVNPVGPRGVYDEAKRFAEAMTIAYRRVHGIPVRIVRIFNTYGPRLRKDDGRAIPTFIDQSLQGEPLTIHGDGTQTRSLCYVDDLIEGIWRVLVTDHLTGPINLGNPEEVTVLELAATIRALTKSRSEIVHCDRPVDDPNVRRPDITLARVELGWEPKTDLKDGLIRTIRSAREKWRRHDHYSQ